MCVCVLDHPAFNYHFSSHLVLLASRNESLNRIHAITNSQTLNFVTISLPYRELCDIATSWNWVNILNKCTNIDTEMHRVLTHQKQLSLLQVSNKAVLEKSRNAFEHKHQKQVIELLNFLLLVCTVQYKHCFSVCKELNCFWVHRHP